jgi:hypothetical protein
MKTPREILMAKHCPAEPKLDAIRGKVVAQCRETQRSARSAFKLTIFPQLLWRELVMPSRWTWGTLAAAWALIFVVNFSLRDPAAAGTVRMSAPAMMSFQEQQKLLNELLADRSLPIDADHPKTFVPRPHSDRLVATRI